MQIKNIVDPVLSWYCKEKRILPFRLTNDPYKIWVSEVMLQQTKVITVIPYYERWIKKYPSIFTVAEAKATSLLNTWEGLGYYSRCRNFHKASKIVVKEFQGIIPSHYNTFISLPGVGEYTASAVLSIAFNKPYAVLDGNVKRVVSRLLGLKHFTKYNRNRIKKLLNRIIPKKFPGKFNQGLMEIGALVCSPLDPKCIVCPIQPWCIASQKDRPEDYPTKKKKRKIPHYEIVAGIIWRGKKFYVQKRDNDVMLGGLWEFPGGKVEGKESLTNALKRELKEECGVSTTIKKKIGCIQHSYSHFSISLHLFHCKENKLKIKNTLNMKWIKPKEIDSLPFPKANHKLFTLLDEMGWNV